MLRNPAIAIAALRAASLGSNANGPLAGTVTLERLLWLEVVQSAAPDESALSAITAAFVLWAPRDTVAKALTQDSGLRTQNCALAWAETLPPGALADLPRAVSEAIAAAFQSCGETVFPALSSGGGTTILSVQAGNGLGWLLTLIEALAAEYGWRVGDLLELPANTAFALWTAARLRHGADWSGPSYADLERLEQASVAGAAQGDQPADQRSQPTHHAPSSAASQTEADPSQGQNNPGEKSPIPNPAAPTIRAASQPTQQQQHQTYNQ